MARSRRDSLNDAAPSGIRKPIPTHWSCRNGEPTVRSGWIRLRLLSLASIGGCRASIVVGE
eukprot:scaffold27828_cov40-Cyclotella_meneghiniana.AAC.3